MTDPAITELLEFWFGGDPPPAPDGARHRLWFQTTREQDDLMRRRYADQVEAALRGDFDGRAATPRGALSLLLLLDQLPRNIWRGSARAFSGDERALAHAVAAVDSGFDRQLPTVMRAFVYLPFEHAESLPAQDRAVSLFETLVEDAAAERELAAGFLDHARQHREIVARFGRFPHRNDLLGRPFTAEEQAYLDGGARRFGQQPAR